MTTIADHPRGGLFHPDLNVGVDPSSLTAGSGKKVWWLGAECGHPWLATVRSVLTLGTQCSVCSGKTILVGVTDLASQCPELAAEWHPALNETLTPETVHYGSHTKVWWLCAAGHEWRAPVSGRTHRGDGCKQCSQKQIKDDAGLVEAFHASNNPGLLEEYISSAEMVVWECEFGHVFTQRVRSFAVTRKCKHCEKEAKALLSHTRPTLYSFLKAAQPVDITRVGSTHKEPLIWVNECGHEAVGRIPATGNKPPACLSCKARKVAALNPLSAELQAEWHPTLNLPTQVDEVSAYSNKSAWWLGKDCGHAWLMSCDARTGQSQGCSVCAGKQVIAGENDLATLYPEVAAEWHPTLNPELTPQEVSAGSSCQAWWVCQESDSHAPWQAAVYSRAKAGKGCPACWGSSFVSKGEKALAEFVESLFAGEPEPVAVLTSVRNVIPGELDIYVPSRKVAIEFNGVYWHSEQAGKGRNYHQDKWQACKDADIQLIQIWEDEWVRNPEQVKSMIAHKLNRSGQVRMYARQTTVADVTKQVAEEFLNTHHVQGYASGSHYVGLFNKSEALVAVLVLRQESTPGVLNIIRYATSVSVVGGFTKLLMFAERNYAPTQFLTFSDHCVSDGGLYEGNGFVVDAVIPPDYKYVVQGERKHKFGYRLKRFRSDPDLLFQEGLTERELAELNSIPRVWDAGKTRWVKSL